MEDMVIIESSGRKEGRHEREEAKVSNQEFG
jgi:hypothetical protein